MPTLQLLLRVWETLVKYNHQELHYITFFYYFCTNNYRKMYKAYTFLHLTV